MKLPFEPFNRAVWRAARVYCPDGWVVAADAPADLDEAITAFKLHGKPVVWAGASERTVFGDAQTNYAFRAWHDAVHLRLHAPFDRAGEQAVYEVQASDVFLVLPKAPAEHRFFCQRLLWTEVMGQLAHQERFGRFPDDQAAFAERYLATGEIAQS